MKLTKFAELAFIAGAGLASAGLATQASALTLPATGYVQYGDAQSYSLPLLQYFDGCTGPGCDYYVVSTPGAIDSLVVVGTGADGNPVETNFDYMDDAYPTPSGASGDIYFSTGTTTDPGTGPFQGVDQDPVGDQTNTWDTDIAALNTFLNGEDMIFFFNNNQEKSLGTAAESLAVWALITVTDAGGTIIGTYEFSNMGGAYLPVSEGGGGVFNGDVTTYTSDGSAPLAGTNTATDYVLSGGNLCLTNLGALKACDGSTLLVGESIIEEFDHNLGANEAAYAIIFPELNDLLAGLTSGTMHIDWRMGCDPASVGYAPEADICTGEQWGYGRSLNNGYEQLFISTATRVVNVPEPATVGLLGLGLLGLGLVRRRRSAA